MNDIDTEMLKQYGLKPIKLDGPVGLDEQE